MNKELNKKYKPEFEHWLNGGKLLVRFTTAKNPYKWYNIEEDFDAKSWNGHYGAQYIIYDEYVELRKALAEGKTIQLDEAKKFSDSTRGWVDLSCESLGISTHLFPVNYYRIKPEEPKFKVGDWVIDKKQKHKPFMVTSLHLKADSPNYVKLDCELYQPKLGEWCWFYDIPHYDMPVLQKFVTTIGGYYITLNSFNSKHINLESVPSFEEGICDSYNRWKYCEPFLGTLPSTIKV